MAQQRPVRFVRKGSTVGFPFDKVASAVKVGMSARGDADTPVRVGVFVDASATPFLIDAVRSAFVPQTTSALVRVERLSDAPIAVKTDTDLAIVISCGSERLQSAVQEIVVFGAPTVVLAESSVEVPFIKEDTPMLGLIAATDAEHLRDALARWILDRTEKGDAFAANFPFMRSAAANRAIASTAVTNTLTGALVFVPGADFPVLTLAQLGMLMQLSAIYGKPIRAERCYEVAGVLVSGALLRALARAASRPAGKAAFAVKALVAGAGTYGMGRALAALYERDVDYTPLNDALGALVRRVRSVVGGALANGAVADERTASRGEA